MTEASSKGRGALEVILFEDGRFRGSLMFTAPEVTVGSDRGALVHLSDANLSPCHAVLRFDGEHCIAENYDEKQGTWVNGIPIEKQEVSPTDEIAIGRFRLRITVHKADATPAPVPVRPPTRTVPSPGKTPSPPARANHPAPRPSMKPIVERSARNPSSWTGHTAKNAFAPSPIPRTQATEKPATSSNLPPLPRPEPLGPPKVASPVKKVETVSRPFPPLPPVARAKSAPLPPPPLAVPKPALGPTHHLATNLAEEEAFESSATLVAPTFIPIESELKNLGTDRTEITNSPEPTPPQVGPPVLDHDDDEAPFVPSFSLYDRLRESLATAVPGGRQTVEVVRFRHGCVVKLRHLHPGEKLRLPGIRKPLGRLSRQGQFAFHRHFPPDGAAISAAGQPVVETEWRALADKRGRIALHPKTQVIFPLPSGEGVLIHWVASAQPISKPSFWPRPDRRMWKLLGASVLAHVLVFAVIGLSSFVKRDYISDNKDGRFARIALKEIELEPPPPPPKKEKKKAKSDAPKTATADPAPKAARLPRTSRPSTPQTQASATAQKLLSALGGLTNSPKISSATAMSNLAAVGPVKGTGGFKVSGAIGKLPGDSLRLAAGGSGIGRLDTKSSSDVGKNLGRILGKGPSGQVRAQVTARPNTMKVEGHLDRGEIQRVINAHIHELQGCFERQLILHPNLAGKVTFEWVIGQTGGVTVVKVKSSSLSSSDATTCMQSAIRRWQFPRPKGGQVTVVYPIALANSGS